MHSVNGSARGTGRTLRQLVNEKIALVAHCRRCKHQRLLYPAEYIARFGDDFLVSELRERLRCVACRARMANLHESSR
jgi:hypothetical protein